MLNRRNVNPGSKAALKGIREGDLISSINGRSTKSITNAEAHALLRNSGESLKLGLNENYIGSPKRRNLKLGQDSADNSRRESLTSVDSLSQEKHSASQNGYNSKQTSLDSENKAITEKLLNYNNNREHSSSITTSEFNKFSASDHCGAAVTSTTTISTSQLINSSRVSRLIDQQKTMADNTNTNNSILNESDKQSDKKLTRNQRKRLNKKLNKQASTNSSSFDSTASTTPSSSSSTICEVLATEQINSDTENNCNYRVDSPPTISTDSTKKTTKKMAKSRSLDDDDNFSPGQIQITEITTEDESTDVNTALISDTEEDVEWETTTELRIPKNTLSTTGSFNAIAMNLDEPKKRCLTAEEEANFKEFLKEFSKQYTEIPEFNDGKICYKSVENLLSPDNLNERRARKRAMLESYFVPTYQNPRFLDIIHEEGSTSDLSDKEASDHKLRKIQKSQLSMDDIPWIDDWGDYTEDDVFMEETQPKLVETKFVTIDECQSSNWKMDRVQSPKDENIEVVFINDTDSETSHADDADDECSREDVLDGKLTTDPKQTSKGAIPKTSMKGNGKSTKQEHAEINNNNNNKQVSNKSGSESSLIKNSSQHVQITSEKRVNSSQKYNISKESTSKLLTEERKSQSNENLSTQKTSSVETKSQPQEKIIEKSKQSEENVIETVKNSQKKKIVEQKVSKHEKSGKEINSKGMGKLPEQVITSKIAKPAIVEKSIVKNNLNEEIPKTKIQSEIQEVNIQHTQIASKEIVGEIVIDTSKKSVSTNAEKFTSKNEKNIKTVATEDKSEKIDTENKSINNTKDSKIETNLDNKTTIESPKEQRIEIVSENSPQTIPNDQLVQEVNIEMNTELENNKTCSKECVIEVKLEEHSNQSKKEPPKDLQKGNNESKAKTDAKITKTVPTHMEIQLEKFQEVTETEIKNNIETTFPIEKTVEIQIEKFGMAPKTQAAKRALNTDTGIEPKVQKIGTSPEIIQPIEKIIKIHVEKSTTSKEMLPNPQLNTTFENNKIGESEHLVETKLDKGTKNEQSNIKNKTERLIQIELENIAKGQSNCQPNTEASNENGNIINVKFENSKKNLSKSKSKNVNRNAGNKIQEHVIEISSSQFNQIKQDLPKQSSTESERIIEVKLDNTKDKQSSQTKKTFEQMNLHSKESEQKTDSSSETKIEFQKSSESKKEYVTDVKVSELSHGIIQPIEHTTVEKSENLNKRLLSQTSVETIIPIEREIDVKTEQSMKNNGQFEKPLICDTLSDSRIKGKNIKEPIKQNTPKSPSERKINIQFENTSNIKDKSKKNPLISERDTNISSRYVTTKLEEFASKTEISSSTVENQSSIGVASKNFNSKTEFPSSTGERIIEVKLENSIEESKNKTTSKSPPERKIDIKLENIPRKNGKSKKTLEKPLICETISTNQNSNNILETKFENFSTKMEEISKSIEQEQICIPSENIMGMDSQNLSNEVNQYSQTHENNTENEIQHTSKSSTERKIDIKLENVNKKIYEKDKTIEKPLICDTLSSNQNISFLQSENCSTIKIEENKLTEETKILSSNGLSNPKSKQTEHIIKVEVENPQKMNTKNNERNTQVKRENLSSSNSSTKVETLKGQESKENIKIKLENSETTNKPKEKPIERLIHVQFENSENEVPKSNTGKESIDTMAISATAELRKCPDGVYNTMEQCHETIEVHEKLHKKLIYPTKQFEDVKSTTTSTHRDTFQNQKSLENPSISGTEKVIEETIIKDSKFEDSTKAAIDLENFKFSFLTPPPTPENSDANILDEASSDEFRNKILVRKLLKLSESSNIKQNIQQIYNLLQEVPIDQLPLEMQEITKELLSLKKEIEIPTDPAFEKEFESIFKTMKELTPQQNLPSPSRPESSNSIGSFGSSSTTTTAKYIPTSSSLTDIQSLIQQDESKIIINPKSLKEISFETIKSLPYGNDILKELANVSDIIETMAVTKIDDSFHITPNHYKSPILNDADDNTSSFVPEMTTPQQHKWLGLRSNVDPKLLVCLSPSQQNFAQHAKQINADQLLDMHQKFIERRSYHETPNNNRLLSIILNEDNSKAESVPPVVPERTYRYTLNPKYSSMPVRFPPPIPEIDQERLSATNLPEWINLARNRCKSVTEYSTNVDFSKNNSNALVTDGKLNYHTYKKTIKELKSIDEDQILEPRKRRSSLPQEIHEKQLKYILEKEREIEREIANLENEKQRLSKESDPPQTSSLPEIRYLKRPTSMPTGCTVHGEFFRQQMYDEYLNKIAEREQRKQQKVIKLSSNNVHELLNEEKPSNIMDFKQLVNIENEFMNKVKQRKQNLGIKESSPESDFNDSESELILKNDLLKTIAQNTKHIPKHLKEFVEFTTKEDQETIIIEQSSRNNGIWSPGQSQQTSESLLSESKKHSTSGPIPPPLPDLPKSSNSEPTEVVWTPKSAGTSPTVERKEFRPVNFESPTLPRKNQPKSEVSQNNNQKDQTIPPWDQNESAVSTLSSTLERRLTSSQSAPLTGLNSLQQSSISSSPSSRLPRAQNPTITLLQKAREGQLPRGASYIEDFRKSPPRKGDERPAIISPGEIIYSVRNEYASESDSEKPKKMVDLGPRKFEGIGPTTKDGMPIVLRSEVKENNQAKWYKRMYETLHKTKDDDYVTIRYKQRKGRYPYSSSGSGYLSEPEANSAPYIYDSDSAYSASHFATLDRRRPQVSRGKENYNNMSSTMPRNLNKQSMSISSTNNSSMKHGTGVYKNQPGRIENYVPGHSSISEKEAKEWWDEVMDIFDGWLDDNSPLPNYSRMLNEAISRRHLEQQKLVPQHSKSYMSQALKESGYESDSTLIFKRRDETSQQLSPQEQKEVYKSIQRGGEVPLHGLRKSVPERPKEPELVPIPPPKGQHHFKDFGPESPRRYVENEVTIHYRSPVRQEIKEAIAEEELARRQAEAMRRIYQEERRRKYLQELHDMNSRRHTDNFTPSQKSPIPLNRYDDFDEITPKYVGIKAPRERTPDRARLVAKALFNFVGQTPRELTFKKGDIIYVRRQIDKNWYEGEHNAMIGLFPFNYVEIIPNDGIKTMIKKPHEGQARAKFNFIAQTHLELSLAKGELVILTRRVDENWFEGRIGNKKGIFPVSYVDVLQYPGEDSSKPVAAPAAHSLLLNGSSGGKQSMGSHHYTPQFPPSSPGTQQQQQQHSIQSSVSYHHAKPVNVTPVSGQQPYGSLSRNVSNKPVNVNQTLHIDTHSEPIPYRAMYKYRPQNEDELELLEGDTVYVLEKCDDGWYVGSSQRTGAFGTFPGNYVERIQ